VNHQNFYLFKLAKKNIGRNMGRSFFIGFSVALSVVMAVWILAFFDGMNHQIEEAVVRGNIGYWQLQEKAFADTTDPLSPHTWTETEAQAIKFPYSPELILDGYLSGPDGSAALQVVGVDYQKHDQAFHLSRNLLAGTWPTQDQRGIVIGGATAERFQYSVGDQLVLNFQDSKGELRSELLPVLAIYRHNGAVFERRFAYVSSDIVEEYLFGATDPRQLIHRVVVMSPDLLQGEKSMHKAHKLTGLELRSWKGVNPEMGVVIDFHHGLMGFFFVIIFITVAVTIITPVSMLWQERKGEIRMMSVIGIPRKKIWRMGMFEALLMTVLAASGASLILVGLIIFYQYNGLDFKELSQGQILERGGIVLPQVIYPRLMLKQIFITYGFVIAIIFTSYSVAIRRVIRKAEVNA
jgi:ABC-type lipoprotein release transport system permease subunit